MIQLWTTNHLHYRSSTDDCHEMSLFLWISTLSSIYFTYSMDIHRITRPTLPQLSLRTVSFCFVIYWQCTYVNNEFWGCWSLSDISDIRHSSPLAMFAGDELPFDHCHPIHPVDQRILLLWQSVWQAYFRHVRHMSCLFIWCVMPVTGTADTITLLMAIID